MHLQSTVQECIANIERRCISRGEQELEIGDKNLCEIIQKSQNLIKSVKAEKASNSDVIGWGQHQPITACDTDNQKYDAFVTTRTELYRDWPRGQHFGASSQSEEGGHQGD